MKTISNTFTVNTVIDGDDAAIAFATPSQISIPCYYTGYVKAQKVTSVTFSLKVGTNAATVTSVTSGTKPTGVAVTGVAANAVTITVGTSATASGLSAGVTFTVNGSYGGKTYSANVTVALIGAAQGDVGARGKVGRFFYYGGTFDTNDNTPFPINDAQAPYFDYIKDGQKRFAVYNPANNPAGGSLKMSQMTPLSQGLPDLNTIGTSWEAMTNDFKYIITEALFGSYAHLGSWIFNGDYMLSQAGVDGTENYTQFTGEGSTWQPNLYMNAKTGKLVANSGVIGGFTINASQIKSSNNNIILNSNGSATIGGFEIATGGTARLKSTLIVGNATSQRIEIIPFLNGTYGSQAIEFIKSGTGNNKEVVMELGFDNNNYGHIGITKVATNQDVVESTMSIDADSLQLNSQNTDYNTDANINILTNSNNALSMFSYNEPSETQKLLKCGIENKTITLRAYKSDGSSAWPEYNYMLDPTTLDKGSVQILSLGALKQILDDSSTYCDRLQKLCVLIVRNI